MIHLSRLKRRAGVRLMLYSYAAEPIDDWVKRYWQREDLRARWRYLRA